MSDATPEQLARLFDAMTAMGRAAAQLLESSSPGALAQLDQVIAGGATLKLEFAMGAVGAMGLRFYAVAPAGRVAELFFFEAPPSSAAFCFVQPSLETHDAADPGPALRH